MLACAHVDESSCSPTGSTPQGRKRLGQVGDDAEPHPVLLDGRRALTDSTFGSRARRMEDYLLGEEVVNREERTGYLCAG